MTDPFEMNKKQYQSDTNITAFLECQRAYILTLKSLISKRKAPKWSS